MTRQALFPLVCIMSHSCHANLEPVSDPTNKVSFRAKRKIKIGEELTILYTDFLEVNIILIQIMLLILVLQAKHNIRTKILKEWKFLCQCTRCSDPSELDTHFSSLQCSCSGYYHQQGHKTLWRCSQCSKERDLTDQYKCLESETEGSHRIDIDKMKSLQEKGCHEHFYISTKIFIHFIDQNQHSSDR